MCLVLLQTFIMHLKNSLYENEWKKQASKLKSIPILQENHAHGNTGYKAQS